MFVQSQDLDFQRYMSLSCFRCSVVWGERWSFALLIGGIVGHHCLLSVHYCLQFNTSVFFNLFLLVLQSSKLHRTKMNSRNYSYEYSIRKKTTSFLNKCSILVQFKVWQVFHYLVKLVPEEYTYHYSFLTYGSRQWLTSRFPFLIFTKQKGENAKWTLPVSIASTIVL